MKKPSKQSVVLMLLGLCITGIGYLLSYKPELMESYKNKFSNGIGKIKNKFFH